MDDQRFIEIETKLAHQEVLIEELNRVISRQQADIHELTEAVKILAKKLRAEIKPVGPADQRPPHY
jgi:SlyX protein